MSSLKQLKNRIKSTQTTVKVTRVMQLIASAKLKKAKSQSSVSDYNFKINKKALDSIMQECIESGSFTIDSQSNFSKIIESIAKEKFGITYTTQAKDEDGEVELASKKGEQDDLFLVVFGSNKGLCGALNINIAKKIEERLKEFKAEYPNGKVDILLIGSKLKPVVKSKIAEFSGINMTEMNNFYKDELNAEDLHEICDYVSEQFKQKNSANIEFVFTKFESTITQNAHIAKLTDHHPATISEVFLTSSLAKLEKWINEAPSDAEFRKQHHDALYSNQSLYLKCVDIFGAENIELQRRLESSKHNPMSVAVKYFEERIRDIEKYKLDLQIVDTEYRVAIDGNGDELLLQICKSYFGALIHSLIKNSLASEHAKRMLAMENATTNGNKMIRSLTVAANKKRQSAITMGLLDIVSGANAVAEA